MIRFLFRFLSMIALAIGAVMVVLDATRTVAASRLVMTPLATSWAAISPDTLERARAFVTGTLGAGFWESATMALLALPGCVVFGGLALVLYAIGRRPGQQAFKN